MSFALVLGMAAAASSGDFRIYLTGDEILEFGVTLSSHELDYVDFPPPFPIYFTLDVSEVNDCEVVAVGIQVLSQQGAEIFGTTISGSENDIYGFRLASEYINTASLAIRCDTGPDEIDKVYIFDIEEGLQD